MTFLPLASSSKGNAYLVSDGDATILLECGLTMRELKHRMGFSLSSVSACFVTHEHKDHSKAAKQLLKAGIPVYMSYGTAEAHDDDMDAATLISAGDVVTIGAMTIRAFETYHNTAEPLGFLICDTRTWESLLFAVDTVNLNYIVPGLDYIAIECNYAQDIMDRRDALPAKVKLRIQRSHMEVDTALRYLHKLDLSQCRTIWLLHLSAACSNEYRFLTTFRREFPGIDIRICPE